VPLKLFSEKSERLMPRRRAPNLRECAPCACVVVFVTSQRVLWLNELPTVAAPVLKASKTLTVGMPTFSGSVAKRERMNWKRVSLTVDLLRMAVSVSCTVWLLEVVSKARSGREYCETPWLRASLWKKL